MASTHVRWLTVSADRCIAAGANSEKTVASYAHYANLAHQMAQARPDELREFVETYPFEKAIRISPLIVLAWRIVGNEFKAECASRASDEIARLCDRDEWANAVAAFTDSIDY